MKCGAADYPLTGDSASVAYAAAVRMRLRALDVPASWPVHLRELHFASCLLHRARVDRRVARVYDRGGPLLPSPSGVIPILAGHSKRSKM